MSAPNPTLYIKAIPAELPDPDKTFELRRDAVDLDGSLNGGVLTKTVALSIDPYLRNQLKRSNVGDIMYSIGIGKVIRSESDSFRDGDYVWTWHHPWSHYAVLSTDVIERKLENPQNLPWHKFLTALGMPALTAWCSYKLFAKAEAGETIYVSAAAGTVGSVVAQLAKLDGLKVIGSAGSDDKVGYLVNELKLDYAFNYNKEGIDDALSKLGPIDIYYDNVGGEALETTINHLNNWSRIILCGFIASYNAEPYGVKNLSRLLDTNTTVTGFLIAQVEKKYGTLGFYTEFAKLVEEGKVVVPDQVSTSLEDAAKLLFDLQLGRNKGKPVVYFPETA